jgi:hypothetical protein
MQGLTSFESVSSRLGKDDWSLRFLAGIELKGAGFGENSADALEKIPMQSIAHLPDLR